MRLLPILTELLKEKSKGEPDIVEHGQLLASLGGYRFTA